MLAVADEGGDETDVSYQPCSESQSPHCESLVLLLQAPFSRHTASSQGNSWVPLHPTLFPIYLGWLSIGPEAPQRLDPESVSVPGLTSLRLLAERLLPGLADLAG